MKAFILILSIVILSAFTWQQDFLSSQKKSVRVRDAYAEKGSMVEATLKKYNIDKNNLNILIVAFKNEQLFDLYAKAKNGFTYTKIKTYTICSGSGVLGPKRRQGDGQVPEGFYYLDRFNPSSSYYLSLGLSYPNLSDKRKSKATNLGGDIFIHGECVTIGCMPMTNDKIKEIYIYAIQAKQSGQAKIPVYIFPYKMSTENIKTFSAEYKGYPEIIKFWENIKAGHDEFMKDSKELTFSVDEKGDYVFN